MTTNNTYKQLRAQASKLPGFNHQTIRHYNRQNLVDLLAGNNVSLSVAQLVKIEADRQINIGAMKAATTKVSQLNQELTQANLELMTLRAELAEAKLARLEGANEYHTEKLTLTKVFTNDEILAAGFVPIWLMDQEIAFAKKVSKEANR